MSQITGKSILTALMKDPEYSAQPESVRKAMEPFILAIPEVLKDFLDKKVDLSTLMDAKIAFLRYCSENEYITKMVDAMPSESFGLFEAKDVTNMMEGSFSALIEVLSGIVKNVPGFLKSLGVTEAEVMALPKSIGFKPNVLKKYTAGKLTIADLLELQPMVIIKNTN
jgi:hypothetical protein